jgi:hypothetical protein
MGRTVIKPPYVIPRHDAKTSTEKGATTSIRVAVFDGIEIESRYRKAHELQTMLDAIREVPSQGQRILGRVFCDSKATNHFAVHLREEASVEDAILLGMYMAHLFIMKLGDHNGIHVFNADGREVFHFSPGNVVPWFPKS